VGWRGARLDGQHRIRAEDHDKELQQKAVIYINTDDTGEVFRAPADRTRWKNYIDEITDDVIDPETNVSLFDRNKAYDAGGRHIRESEKRGIMERNSAHWRAGIGFGLFAVFPAFRYPFA
jgi:hypothetical protein